MLSAQGVRCRYGAAEILRGVDIEVDSGEVVALLGRNGMGKTSLVRTIVGMRPPYLSDGRVMWDGADISQAPSHAIAREGISIVPQGRHIFGSLTVRENLTVAARGRSGDGDWDVQRVLEFFPRLGERMDSWGGNLSGGEQQMLAIGRALMTNPRLVLMDEPSEGLAPIVVGQIRQRLESLKDHLTILLVEQNLGLAMRVADRIYILGERGHIVWHGTPAELDADDTTKKSHLGV